MGKKMLVALVNRIIKNFNKKKMNRVTSGPFLVSRTGDLG
jgi:hypothetical protein